MRIARIFLLVAGFLSLGAAALHLAIFFVPQWSSIFGDRDPSNPLLFRAVTLGVTILLAVWGFYGLSGAGLVRRLPPLRLGIFLIGAIYISYGLLVILRLLALADFLPPGGTMDLPALLVTLGALTAGLCYWLGLATGWRQLGGKPASATL
jgi:hypothetical protein